MSKLSDYALVVLTHLACANDAVRTSQELAERSGVPSPTVSKILKGLSKAGIVVSHRGRRGGYTLSRSPEEISVAAVVEALEGPIALTECSSTDGCCSLESVCVAKGQWGPISRAIHETLQGLPLSALSPRPVLIGRPQGLTTLTLNRVTT